MEGITYCLVSVSVFIWKIVIRRDTCSLTICKALHVNPIIWLTSTAHRTHSYIHIILSLILSFSVVVYICASAIRAPLCPLNRQALRSLTLIRIVHLVETTSTIYSLYGGVYTSRLHRVYVCLCCRCRIRSCSYISRAHYSMFHISCFTSRVRRVAYECFVCCLACVLEMIFISLSTWKWCQGRLIQYMIIFQFSSLSTLHSPFPPSLSFSLFYLFLFTLHFALSAPTPISILPSSSHFNSRFFFLHIFIAVSSIVRALYITLTLGRRVCLNIVDIIELLYTHLLTQHIAIVLFGSLSHCSHLAIFFCWSSIDGTPQTHAHTHTRCPVALIALLSCRDVAELLLLYRAFVVHLRSFLSSNFFFVFALSLSLSRLRFVGAVWRWSWSCSVGYCCLVLRIICKQLPISMFNVIQHIFLIYLFLFGSIKLS